MSGNLQVFHFERGYAQGTLYKCSHPGDQSGDYVPLAQAEALRAERDKLYTVLEEIENLGAENPDKNMTTEMFAAAHMALVRFDRKQLAATSREPDGRDAD